MVRRQRRQGGRAAPPGRRSQGRWKGRGVLLFVAAGVVVVGLVVMSLLGPSNGSDGNGERQFPAFAYNSAMTLAGYKVAARVPEALSVIPCYCGCGPAQGHLSLEECFLSSSGFFTDHASNCHLCVGEAVDVGKWYDDGLTLKDIRTRIVEKYSYHGPPTNTPPI